jgi:hypothetical protein
MNNRTELAGKLMAQGNSNDGPIGIMDPWLLSIVITTLVNNHIGTTIDYPPSIVTVPLVSMVTVPLVSMVTGTMVHCLLYMFPVIV